MMPSMFISPMAMICIFGFALKHLLFAENEYVLARGRREKWFDLAKNQAIPMYFDLNLTYIHS